jgi:hypothetical protein
LAQAVTGYPRGFTAALWGVLGALLLTGLWLIPGALELRFDLPLPWRLSARTSVAALHAVGAYLMLILLGSLAIVHMRLGWRRGLARRSGLSTASVLLVLALTALGMDHITDERWSALSSAAHLISGLLLATLVPLHARARRRSAEALRTA